MSFTATEQSRLLTMSFLRLSLRTLIGSPGFAAVVVLSLGLGVGACTVVFSRIQSVYGYEAPDPKSDRIVKIGSTQRAVSWQRVDIVPLDRVRAWIDVDLRTLEPFGRLGRGRCKKRIRALLQEMLDHAHP